MTPRRSHATPLPCGSITIELLIAFALFTTLASAILLLSGLAADARYALIHAFHLRDIAEREVERRDHYAYGSTASTTDSDGYEYWFQVSRVAISPCLDVLRVDVWRRLQTISRVAYNSNITEVDRLGNDCAYGETDTWEQAIASTSYSGEEGSAIDVLGGIALVGTKSSPYLAIFDSHADEQIAIAADFSLYAPVNAIDQVLVENDGVYRRLAYVALATTSKQFAVVDVSDIAHPVLLASSTLLGVDPAGSFPEGFRLYAYDGMVHIAARETAGPELHIYDVHDPQHPVHRSSLSVNSTLNDLYVRDEGARRILYAASARDSAEVALFDVTDPVHISEILDKRIDLPGSQDGRSITVLGNQMFVGRSSNTAGPELLRYELSNTGAALTGSGEVATHVTGINVVGSTVFIAATPDGRTNRRIEVWQSAASLTRHLQYLVPALAFRGFDYDGGTLFVTRETSLLLQAITSL